MNVGSYRVRYLLPFSLSEQGERTVEPENPIFALCELELRSDSIAKKKTWITMN